MLTKFTSFLTELFDDARDLSAETRAFLRRFWAVFAVLGAMTLGGFIFGAATASTAANTETWEITIASRLFLLKLVGAVIAFIVAVALALLTANWFDNTKLGARMFHSDDRGLVKVFVGLLIAAALVLAGAVR